MVTHIPQSIKNLNERKQLEKDARDGLTEVRDAIIEIAEIVSELYTAASENKEGGENG